VDKIHIRKSLAVYYVMSLQDSRSKSAYEIAREALQGGITMLQLREKKAPLKQVIEEGRMLKELCGKFNVPFIVNDRVDLAMILDADGVHLGQEDIPCSAARQLLGMNKIIGVSAGTYEEAERGIEDGADYLGVGSVYATNTKADAGEPIGTALINRIQRTWDIPIVGIGGIQGSNAAAVIQAGADGVAVVSAISAHDQPEAAARELKRVVTQQTP
jgi:thiamine-phosphate pyrophosphorylase